MTGQLYTAASGLLAEGRRMELVSNNLANLSTAGFRAQRSFNAVYNGVTEHADEKIRSANQGVALAGSFEVPGPGPIQMTGRGLDVFLAEGEFLAVRSPGGTRYTRAGSLGVSADGELTDGSGNPVLNPTGQPIAGLTGAAEIAVDGRVLNQGAEVGRLQVVRDEADLLVPEGDGLYGPRESGAAPQAVEAPIVSVGAIEGSATDALSELVQLIESQRAFESYQKLINLTMNEVNRRAINDIAASRKACEEKTMQRALWSASSGMQAQQMQIDTIANNLANVNTNGFKRSRAEFHDLLYQTVLAPGAASSSTTKNPSGIQLGLGAKPAAIKKLFGQGDMKRTENPLDVAIQGQGFFKVALPDGSTGYTRDGAFTANQDGQLVTSQGYPMDPPITLPPDSLSISIGADGTVSVTQPGQTTANEVGQIELANFVNPTGLRSLGGNLFLPSDSSGDPQDGTPGLDGLGSIQQDFLEVSNVSIVNELVDMIAAQRAYELNSRAIKASDEMLQQLNNLVR